MNKISHLLILFSLSALLFSSCKKEIEGFGPKTPNLPVNYGLQNCPDIAIFTAGAEDLLSEMAPYLHFGDNPPKIDTFFHAPSIYLIKHIANGPFTLVNGQNFRYPFSFMLKGQHNGTFDSLRFKEPIVKNNDYHIYAEAGTRDSIFIMGEGDLFTVYYKINLTLSTWAQNPGMNTYLQPLNGQQLVEKVILSGKAINDYVPEYVFTKWNKEVIRTSSYHEYPGLNNSPYFVTAELDTIHKIDVRYLDTLSIPRVKAIKDIHLGVRVENSINVPNLSFFALHDILLYSYEDDLTIDSEFFEGENRSRP